MSYRPTPIETTRERFEKAYFPAMQEAQVRSMLAQQEAEFAPGGRRRVAAMDPRYREAELAGREAEISGHYAAADAKRRKMEMEAALLGPQIRNLEARSFERTAAGGQHMSQQGLAEAAFGPEMAKTQAVTDWVGTERPAIERDKLRLGWARLGNTAEWHKGQLSAGKGKSPVDKMWNVLGKLAGAYSGGTAQRGLDPDTGEPVVESFFTPQQSAKVRLFGADALRIFDELPDKDKASVHRQLIEAHGYGGVLARESARRQQGYPPLELLPDVAELVMGGLPAPGEIGVASRKGVAAPSTGELPPQKAQSEQQKRAEESARKEAETRQKSYKEWESRITLAEADIERKEVALARMTTKRKERGALGMFSGPSDEEVVLARQLEQAQGRLEELRGGF